MFVVVKTKNFFQDGGIGENQKLKILKKKLRET
jgi:hypothetical protein